MKKAPPPDPHRENFCRLGQGVIDYNCVKLLFILVVRTTEMRRLMGPCFPTGGLVGAWLLETLTDCFCERVWFTMIFDMIFDICYDI